MKTVWTKLALQDLEHVRSYIEASHPDAANSVLLKIAKAVQSLRSYENLGCPGRIKGTRELTVVGTPFLVPYRIRDERIEILAVLHGARRWPKNI